MYVPTANAQACTSNDQCDVDRICDLDPTHGTHQTCVPDPAANPECTTQDECSAGYYCDVNTSSATYTQCVAGTASALGSGGTNNIPTTNGDDVKSLNGAMGVIMQVFAWLLGTAGVVLDRAVYYTVVTMGNYVNDLSAIGVAWRILRDIGNIILIFGFLAIGITTILNAEWYSGKKMLPMLLASAIFLNFSLFISEAVIDVGNLFATQFYTAINAGQGAGADITIANEGISNKLMNQLGLQQIYGAARGGNTKIFDGDYPIIIAFMAIILFMVAAFVMFSLAFILIARFVALVFIIVVAPIGFVGLAIPKLKSMADMWWEQLFAQTLTAPALLLLLYVALAVITDVNFLVGFKVTSGTSLIDWTSGETQGIGQFAGMMLAFLVAMGLLLAVMVLAKKMSAFGAGAAMKLGGLASFGAASLAGRGTLGMAGVALSNKRMKSWARNSRVAALGVGLGKGLSSRTYDFRNVPGAGAALGAFGISAGSSIPFTAKEVHEAGYGAKPIKKFLKEGREENEQAGREMDFKDTQTRVKEAKSLLEEAKKDLAAGRITSAEFARIKNNLEPGIAKDEKDIAAMLAKMSTKQLEELSGIKKGTDELVQNLSPQQFEALMKSDKFSDSEKANIKESRFRPLKDAVENTTLSSADKVKAIKNALNNYSKGELEALPADMIAKNEVLDNLSDKQRDTIADAKERTAAEKKMVRDSSPSGKVEGRYQADRKSVV